MARGLLVATILCVAGMSGCRQNGSAVDSVDISVPEQPTAPTELSDEQKAAVEAIAATGGEIQTDENGIPVRIDLASERVFADEALVRAALTFPGLKVLRLTVSSVPAATLADLVTLTNLEELFLQDAAIDDAGLEAILRALPNLHRLTLRRLNGVTDGALDAVADCRNLEVLALIEMNQVTGVGLERLVTCPRLRSLDLRNCGRLTPDDFKRLAAMAGLVEVKFGGPAINDEMADVIIGLRKVQSVTIEDAEISAAFLNRLASDAPTAQRLRTLAFARCYGVTDEALASLARFPNLETLSLRDLMMTGTFLAALSDAAPLPLKTLIATNAFLDDDAAERLPDVLPNLVQLDLRGNTGLGEDAKQSFDKLKNLKELKLE